MSPPISFPQTMNPPTDRFIELATRPLCDNAEMKLAAEVELRRRIQSEDTENVNNAIHVLDNANSHPEQKWWFRTLLLLMAVATTCSLVQTVKQYRSITSISFLATHGSISPVLAASQVEEITPQQELILFGAKGAISESSRWKPLWDSDSRNLVYFTNYASAHIVEKKKPSPELIAESLRLDPDNGWLPALSATSDAKEIVSTAKSNLKNDRRVARRWQIHDSKRLTASLEAFHQAINKPRFESYQDSLLIQRTSLLKPRIDFASQFPAFFLGMFHNYPSLHLKKANDLLAAGAQNCAEIGDVDGFRRIISDWETLQSSLTRNGVSLVDVLVAKAVLNIPSANFRDAAQQLGLRPETDRFTRINSAFHDGVEMKKRNLPRPKQVKTAVSHGSIIAGTTIPMMGSQVKSPPPITEEDLKPGRLADHALFERACSIAAWILLGSAAGLAGLHRFRHGILNHRLAARLSLLGTPIDWILLISGGILLPLICYFLVTRYTPLSFRDWSLRWTVFMVPSLQVGAFVTSMLVLPVVIARWRLGTRAGFLGLQSKRMSLGAFAAICSLTAIPMIGLGHHMRSEWFLIPISLPIAFPLVWLLVGLFKAVFGSNEAALRTEILARWIVPVWITGMLVMALSAPLLYKSEQYWIQRDKLMEITAETHGVSRYEWLVTQQLRKELLEQMEQIR